MEKFEEQVRMVSGCRSNEGLGDGGYKHRNVTQLRLTQPSLTWMNIFKF